MTLNLNRKWTPGPPRKLAPAQEAQVRRWHEQGYNAPQIQAMLLEKHGKAVSVRLIKLTYKRDG